MNWTGRTYNVKLQRYGAKRYQRGARLTTLLFSGLTSCNKNRMATRYITLWREQVTSWRRPCQTCMFCLRNRSAPAVICWVINHCLEVSCKVDQITSAEREWFIYLQLTDKQWFITQQITHKSWSFSILTHRKRRKSNCFLQILRTVRHHIKKSRQQFWL